MTLKIYVKPHGHAASGPRHAPIEPTCGEEACAGFPVVREAGRRRSVPAPVAQEPRRAVHGVKHPLLQRIVLHGSLPFRSCSGTAISLLCYGVVETTYLAREYLVLSQQVAPSREKLCQQLERLKLPLKAVSLILAGQALGREEQPLCSNICA